MLVLVSSLTFGLWSIQDSGGVTTPLLSPTQGPPSGNRATSVPMVVPTPTVTRPSGTLAREGYLNWQGLIMPTVSPYIAEGFAEDMVFTNALVILWTLVPEARQYIDQCYLRGVRLRFVHKPIQGTPPIPPGSNSVSVLEFSDELRTRSTGSLAATMAGLFYLGAKQGYQSWPEWIDDQERSWDYIAIAWQKFPIQFNGEIIKQYPQDQVFNDLVEEWQSLGVSFLIRRDPAFAGFPR